jgi:hypothetical protein
MENSNPATNDPGGNTAHQARVLEALVRVGVCYRLAPKTNSKALTQGQKYLRYQKGFASPSKRASRDFVQRSSCGGALTAHPQACQHPAAACRARLPEKAANTLNGRAATHIAAG